MAGGDPDTCRYDNLEIVTDTRGSFRGGYRADSVLVRGIGFDPGASTGPAMTLRVEARGVVHTYHLTNAAMEYMLSQQQAKLSVTLDVTYDPGAHTWVLHELSLDGERLGHVSLDGEVDGVGPVHSADQLSVAAKSAAIRRIHGTLDSTVFVTSMVLPMILDHLPQAPTADAVEVAVRAEMTTLAGRARAFLTASGASATTVAAVTTAITDFPHAQHPMDLTVTAATPLPLSDIVTVGTVPDGYLTLAKRVAVDATYAGPIGPSPARPSPGRP